MDFEKARLVLEGLEKAKAHLERELGRKCDWDDPDDRNLYLRDERFKSRAATLDALVPTRTCPHCRVLKLASKSWVIDKARKRAVCRSCFWIAFGKLPNETVQDVNVCIFSNEETRYDISGIALKTARTIADVSMAEFARRAGWSRPYQMRLERGEVKSVNQDVAKTILQVLREAGLVTIDFKFNL